MNVAQSLNKAFLKQPCNESEVIRFKEALDSLLKHVTSDESEEHNKKLVDKFLSELIGRKYFINTFKDDDLVIHNGDRSKDVGVILEFKKPNSTEFSRPDGLDRKSLQQLVFYFLEQRIDFKNSNLKYLIMTNCCEWIVYDITVFAKCFDTVDLRRKYQDWKYRKENRLQDSSTDWFYKNISSPAIQRHIQDLHDPVYFNLQDLEKVKDDKKLIPIIKFFTPFHLLREPFANDSNTLNKGFYSELLHLIGLIEVTDGGKKVITRPELGRRNSASFIEQIIDEIDYLPISSKYKGTTKEEHVFNVALQLSITWINRTLFLKLLEGQISSYKRDENFRILDIGKIKDFDIYNSLFFKVLAVEPQERNLEINELFGKVPYLNSSLFEVTELEQQAIRVSSLQNTKKLPIFGSTILKDAKGKKLTGELPLLEYLFHFLDAYSFGNVDSSAIRKENKDIINSAVLGLIFEKINGYKDGSFFTPGYVTMYMCREGIRASLLQKLNNSFGWECTSFDELKSFVGYENRIEINGIIDSLTICDPAVGSGHFLVSALNEIIAIKSELNILMDNHNRLLRDYDIAVENDELFVTHKDGAIFEYFPNNRESQRIQETLFNEKRKIIENCLFGVDINPNSVNICRLRLWIELLKNAYYKADGQLETLPNIDINIKEGNSLISKYPVRVGGSILKDIDGRTKFGKKIIEYKQLVSDYKRTSNKNAKRQVTDNLKTIKREIIMEFQLSLFEDETKHIQEHNIYSVSMEWMIEFPEILDDNGYFLGFDIVIGNPPYGVSIKALEREIITYSLGKVPDYEIYYYFIELAHKLVRNEGMMSYIVPNSYLFNTYAKTYRISILDKWKVIEILDCSGFSIFESATVRNTINLWAKEESTQTGYRNTNGAISFNELIQRPRILVQKEDLLEMNQNWGLAFRLPADAIDLVAKIKRGKHSIGFYFPEISQGLIAYDKYQGQSSEIIKSRAYHFPEYREGLKLWLWGEDVKRYSVSWNQLEYIDYCSGIANPRQPHFFYGRRILIREITNPSVYASVIDYEAYNDPSIIIVKDGTLYPLDLVLGIINSKLSSFYHFNHSPKATKGAFPKILVEDIKTFPLPSISIDESRVGRVIENVCRIIDIKNSPEPINTECIEAEIDIDVYKLYELTYEEVRIVDPNFQFTEEHYNEF